MSNVYYCPSQFGLRPVGEIEWRGDSYEFHLTAVWEDENSKLYWADDSGCSCPSPFENYESKEALETGSFFQLIAHLSRRLGELDATYHEKADPQVMNVISRLRLSKDTL